MRYPVALAALRDSARFHRRGPYRHRRTASRAGQQTAIYRWFKGESRGVIPRVHLADAVRREEADGLYYTGD